MCLGRIVPETRSFREIFTWNLKNHREISGFALWIMWCTLLIYMKFFQVSHFSSANLATSPFCGIYKHEYSSSLFMRLCLIWFNVFIIGRYTLNTVKVEKKIIKDIKFCSERDHGYRSRTGSIKSRYPSFYPHHQHPGMQSYYTIHHVWSVSITIEYQIYFFATIYQASKIQIEPILNFL